jgi:putative membrane protein
MAFAMLRLTEPEKSAISEAITRAEAATSGEIVFAITDASGRYRHSSLLLALAGMALASAVYLAAPVRHSISLLLWTEILSLTLLYALAPYFPWRRVFVAGREMDERVRASAQLEFFSSGLHRTRDGSGVLIYLSLMERRVVVLGDSGIHAKMGEARWDHVRDLIVSGIREGEACAGICRAIEACGRTLEEHFPRRPDDVNELPDRVIDRTAP